LITSNSTPQQAEKDSHEAQNTKEHHKKTARRYRPNNLSLRESIDFYMTPERRWIGALSGDGYPEIGWQGKVYKVHRLLMKLEGHDIKGKVVLHIDDDPLNLSLSNLRVGTQAENMADKAKKGRCRYQKPLTDTEIDKIVQYHKQGVSGFHISKLTGHTRSTVRKYVKAYEKQEKQQSRISVFDITEGDHTPLHLKSLSEGCRESFITH